MTFPPIPPSLRTSAAGFIGATLGWIAMIPEVPTSLARACAFLSTLVLGGGLVLAADHRSVAAVARPCPICGYNPNGPPAGPGPSTP